MKKLLIGLVFILILGAWGCNLPGAADKTSPTNTESPLPPAEDTPVAPVFTDVPPTPTEIPPTPTATVTPIPPVEIPLTIAYLQAGDVYLWRDGGLIIRLTALGDVRDVNLAPDASVVLFRRGADIYNSDLWAIDADGSNMRLLFNDASFDALVPGQQNYMRFMEFIPGTTQIAFNTAYTWEGPGQPANNDLQILDYASGIHTVLLAPGNAGGTMDYSPDGSWVALVSGDKIEIMNPDGSNRRTALTFPFVYTYSEWTYLPALTWSADSNTFRVAIPAQDPLGDPSAFSNIYEVRRDGSMMHIGEYVSVPVFISFPHLSPLGDTVLFVGAPGAGSTQKIHLNAQDSTYGYEIFTGENLEVIGYAPDGAHYLFFENISSLWLGAGSGTPVLINGAGGLRAVKWVEPGRFIAVWTGGPTVTQLRLYTLDGMSLSITDTLDGTNNYDYAPRP